jgi:hypothetical protein
MVFGTHTSLILRKVAFNGGLWLDARDSHGPAPEIRTGNASASLRRAEPDVLNSYIEAEIPIPAFAELGNIAKNWWHE